MEERSSRQERKGLIAAEEDLNCIVQEMRNESKVQEGERQRRRAEAQDQREEKKERWTVEEEQARKERELTQRKNQEQHEIIKRGRQAQARRGNNKRGGRRKNLSTTSVRRRKNSGSAKRVKASVISCGNTCGSLRTCTRRYGKAWRSLSTGNGCWSWSSQFQRRKRSKDVQRNRINGDELMTITATHKLERARDHTLPLYTSFACTFLSRIYELCYTTRSHSS